MIPLTGWISSRFGRKNYFLFSVTTFVVVGLVVSMWMMSKWNAQVGPQNILAALVVSGRSNGLIFAQLSAIAMATVPAPEMGNAASHVRSPAQYQLGVGCIASDQPARGAPAGASVASGRAFFDRRRLEDERAWTPNAGCANLSLCGSDL